VPRDLSGSAITSRSTLALSRAGDATGHAKPPTSDEFSPPHARPKRLGDEGIVSTQMGSLIGTETSFALQHEMRSDVRFGSLADMSAIFDHVRFAPQSRHPGTGLGCPLSATSGHHSITSSARARSVGGTVTPRVRAVLRLITSSYLVAACTGSSEGSSPFRMRSI